MYKIDTNTTNDRTQEETNINDSSINKKAAVASAGLTKAEAAAYHEHYNQHLAKLVGRTWDLRPLREKEEAAHGLAFMFCKEADSDDITEIEPVVAIKHRLRISLALARETNPTDAAVYEWLRVKQLEAHSKNDAYNLRAGVKWISRITTGTICEEIKCFKNRQTILDAINRLESAGLIITERTGLYLEESHRTGRKRDIALWLHVPQTIEADDYIGFDDEECLNHGIAKALVLAAFRNKTFATFDKEGHSYKRLVASELAEALPYDRNSIGCLLKALVKDGELTKAENSKKLYRRG